MRTVRSKERARGEKNWRESDHAWRKRDSTWRKSDKRGEKVNFCWRKKKIHHKTTTMAAKNAASASCHRCTTRPKVWRIIEQETETRTPRGDRDSGEFITHATHNRDRASERARSRSRSRANAWMDGCFVGAQCASQR